MGELTNAPPVVREPCRSRKRREDSAPMAARARALAAKNAKNAKNATRIFDPPINARAPDLATLPNEEVS